MKLIKAIIIVASLLAFSSCGLSTIKYSSNGASIPVEAKTFSVDYIENRAAYVDPILSNELTEELKDKFRSETNLSEVLDGDGDLHFEGEIVKDFLRPVNITRDEYAAATRLTIVVKVKYVNRLDDKFDYDTQFSAYRDMAETQDRTTVGESLVKEIIEQIVEDIYNKAVVNW
ncbi:lipopolysaccharide assembly protein [Balneicella halophila]|uniref:Lipopolysaccharide assembly protein n=1 Tax=Balneicella halophila TaxID=1537566 RepID=A0A7L4UQK1_BALHA|nr:LptE family protein [Balneicella halophila]PVX52058.1 lipopolysaccharide assembly protein [Balneicella halophila]